MIKVDGQQYEVEVEEFRDNSPEAPAAGGAEYRPPAPAPAAKPDAGKEHAAPAGALQMTAPMPGAILAVNVSAGDQVKKGQVLVVFEAMKMENEIVASADGVVAAVHVSKGDSVASGDVLVSLV